MVGMPVILSFFLPPALFFFPQNLPLNRVDIQRKELLFNFISL